jgi:heat shock protein HslJ
VPGTEITLTFTDESVVAVAGCNTITGGFDVDDGVLHVDAMAQTLMACPDELQTQDEWLAEFLGSEPEARLADDVLTLTFGEVTITATELI